MLLRPRRPRLARKRTGRRARSTHSTHEGEPRMTNTTTTATVETLTAEVKVLQVGNRQITLSVAKQLDEVPLVDLEVMGRVHLGGNAYPYLVIGRHAATGGLAL